MCSSKLLSEIKNHRETQPEELTGLEKEGCEKWVLDKDRQILIGLEVSSSLRMPSIFKGFMIKDKIKL